MLASLLIVFREVLEAGLIIGIVLAASEGVAHRGRWVAAGVASGLCGAGILAAFAGQLGRALAGDGQEVFNAAVLCIAVVMLGWHTLWMASHGRRMTREMRALGHAVAAGRRSMLAMAVVVAVAVLREGGEVVLFLYGIAVSARVGLVPMLAGGLLGVAAGAAVSWLLYRGLLVIPVHRLFAVTSWLVALLAAGMAGQAAALLAGDDIIPAWGYQLWDTSWLISDGSLLGKAATALIGYADRPMGVQLAAWGLTLFVLLAGGRVLRAGTDRPAGATLPAARP
jgi:high-affinity iron transporter